MKYSALMIAIFVLVAPYYAQAETVLRIGDDITVNANQVVAGDYYVSVGPVGNTAMSGTVEGDMYAFGGSVTTNGTIQNDLSIIGGTAQVHATVTDDVRILAGEATIAEHVGGDLFVIAGKLTVLSSATIDGDVIFFGGEAEIGGTVGGSVLGNADRIRIDGPIGKDVDVVASSELALGEHAAVEGSVKYASQKPLLRAQNANVEGEVVQNEYKPTVAQTNGRNTLVPVFVALFAALSLFLLFKNELQAYVQEVHAHPLRSGAFGVAALFLAPVVSVVLIATVLGMLVGIAGLAMSVLLFTLGYALAGVLVGSYLAKIFTKKITVSLVWIVIGTFAFHAFLMVPVAGFVAFAAVYALASGGVAYSLYKMLA